MTFRTGTNEDAEDVVQEAYVRAIRYSNSFNGDNFDRWFSAILNNCLREFKNNEKGYSVANHDEEDSAPCPSYPLKVMREVYELIDTKSIVQMEVLNLYFKQEYTATDISKILPYTYAQCHQIIQRFRNELRELYKE